MRKLKKNGFTPLETIQGPTPEKKPRFLTGFTLVEILASVLVMTVVIVPLMIYGAGNLAMDVEIRQKIKCQMLTEAELERMKERLRISFSEGFTSKSRWPTNLKKRDSSYNHYLVDRTVTVVTSTLKMIEISGGYDTDKNDSLGTDETMVTLATQYAKR